MVVSEPVVTALGTVGYAVDGVMVRDSSRARGGGAFDEQGHEAPDLASVESMVGGLNRSVDPVGIEELVPLDQMCAHRVDALFFSDVHDRNCGPVDGGREGSSVGFIRFECTLIPLPPLSDAHAIPIHTTTQVTEEPRHGPSLPDRRVVRAAGRRAASGCRPGRRRRVSEVLHDALAA